MLMGRGASVFQGAADSFNQFIMGLGETIGTAVGALFHPETKVELGSLDPVYEKFGLSVFDALEPMHSLADEALETATAGQTKAEDITKALTGSVNGSFTDAVENHAGIVGQITKKAEEFGAWSSDKQVDINRAFALGASAQAAVNDVNRINWQTTTEYMHQNDEINRAQTEALALHENQMVWMTETQTRSYGLSPTQAESDPNDWVWLAKNAGKDYTFLAKGSWVGTMSVLVNNTSGNSDSFTYRITKNNRGPWKFNSPELGTRGRDMLCWVTPAWGNHKREYVLKPTVGFEEGPYRGFEHTEAYVNEIEGNPIRFDPGDCIVFVNGIITTANEDVLVSTPGVEDYKTVPKGEVIYPFHKIRAKSPNLVKFTEA